MSFRDQSSTKLFCQTIISQLHLKHPVVVDVLHILWTINQLLCVIYHQCIHFFLHCRNPLLLLRGVHSFPEWHISTTINRSACQWKKVVPDVIHFGHLTVRIGLPVFLEKLFFGLYLVNFLRLWWLWPYVIFLPFLCNHIFHTSFSNPASVTELVPNGSGLK